MNHSHAITVFVRFFATAVVCCFSIQLYAVDVIAHRGNACGMIENSLEAVSSARDAGVDAVELDVRVSSDGVAYLFHDDKINDIPIQRLAYARIRELTQPGEAPELANVLATNRFDGFYILDLKQIELNQISELIFAVQQPRLEPRKIVFQSESFELLEAIHAKLPSNRYYLLERLERRFPYLFAPKPSKVILRTTAQFIEGVSLKGRSFLDQSYIHRLKKTGLRVFVWTINSESRAIHYRKSGVDGIITDKPLAFLDAFGRKTDHAESCSDR